ncbi:hypothetical protein ACMHYJ_01975 [Castellaniella hirudinis]|uniref:hypothetical protein n=1 Tax=Castellaniella hirudinis TaxID=1144617 RepID=UPI0039C43958
MSVLRVLPALLSAAGGEWDNGVCSPTSDVCFYGETPAAGLISGNDLLTLIGASAAGTKHNSNVTWLRVAAGGQKLYIAQKTILYGVSIGTLRALGLLSLTGQVVSIGGKTFRVRTLCGSISNPWSGGAWAADPSHQYGCEWNKIMYRLYGGGGVSGEGIPYGELAKYSAAELGLLGDETPGSRTLLVANNTNNYGLFRGTWGPMGHSYGTIIGAPSARGYRPVLQLIE